MDFKWTSTSLRPSVGITLPWASCSFLPVLSLALTPALAHDARKTGASALESRMMVTAHRGPPSLPPSRGPR